MRTSAKMLKKLVGKGNVVYSICRFLASQGSFLMKPDQMDVVNPLLIVTLIPLFEITLYPLLRKYKVNFSPLRRMTTGLILAGISFLFAAALQFEIDVSLICHNKLFLNSWKRQTQRKGSAWCSSQQNVCPILLKMLTILKIAKSGKIRVVQTCMRILRSLSYSNVCNMCDTKFMQSILFISQKGLTPLPKENDFSVRIVNMAPCNIELTSADDTFNGKIVQQQTVRFEYIC